MMLIRARGILRYLYFFTLQISTSPFLLLLIISGGHTTIAITLLQPASDVKSFGGEHYVDATLLHSSQYYRSSPSIYTARVLLYEGHDIRAGRCHAIGQWQQYRPRYIRGAGS